MKSLKAVHHELARPDIQLRILGNTNGHPDFAERLRQVNLLPFRPIAMEILQVNVGKMCNQTCAHCHVDAGPDREEIMTREVMQDCLSALRQSDIKTVDLTGGAPEMNPDFRWFVGEIYRLGRQIMVRSNLTILTVNKQYRQLPGFFAEHGVTVVSSLPCYTAENTDKQRGQGVFERSIRALQELNSVGYGHPGSGLQLHLIYNPLGAFLPPSQDQLRADYQRILKENHGIVFNDLYCITNMPISRFLQFLQSAGQTTEYMDLLVQAFNPEAARGVMCRSTLSVGWDGTLYDCDFNQMLELPVRIASTGHIRDFDVADLRARNIVLSQHCYGCTAGAGSSCGGKIV
jgi:radical SAM/Cys-rich protein